MSRQHGDKARFHRLRKQSIERRRKVRELRDRLALAPAPGIEVVSGIASDAAKAKPPVI
jgi:hypothetical protein